MSTEVEAALLWLKALLESRDIEYQVVGGFAATIHGGSREVADIDLYIARSDIEVLLPSLEPYISKPLAHYIEGSWDLEYLQLIYQTQKIEIGLSPGTKIQSAYDNTWHELPIDYSTSVIKRYHGIDVPVMSIAQLIHYKRILGRDVDLFDVKALECL
ncbi:hypothetical protein MGA5115_03497 [Marinomonas gallaica]|uniref:MazG-related protein n=1 Tax=Marinomonas gallaica TaxID=1806667 RepID=A0A1C3JVZ8_9GAMM|nr:MazG-related protein [Marinomonas gallaica]SBT19335.1 hypothetical protein MGA5115_03497 [Marinomonas gallaica]SBT22841.1 hypothetical protein MGA5116_03471 [Marinomonas gallaica]